MALLLPLMGWLVARIQGPQVEREAYGSLTAIARLKTDQIENWLNERRENGRMLSADTGFARLVGQLPRPAAPRGRAHEELVRQLTQLREAYGYDSLQLLDVRGHVRLSSPEQVEVPQSIDSMVQQVLDDGQALRRELSVNGQAQLQWLLPVFDADGPQQGLIALVLMRANEMDVDAADIDLANLKIAADALTSLTAEFASEAVRTGADLDGTLEALRVSGRLLLGLPL